MTYLVPREHCSPIEVQELLDTVSFALETVQMALSIRQSSGHLLLSLDEHLESDDSEEQEAGRVAFEALDTARMAYSDLAAVLASPKLAGLGLDLRFWSCYDWCESRLFSGSAQSAGQIGLRYELVEARRRTSALTSRMNQLNGHPLTTH